MADLVLTRAPRRRPPRHGAPWHAWLLAALLLLAQAAGLHHAVAHGGPGRAAPDAAHRLAAAHDAHDAHPGGEASAADVHGHEAGDAQCRLVDALTHGDVATAPLAPEPWPAVASTAPTAAPGATGAAAPACRPPPARAPPQQG